MHAGQIKTQLRNEGSVADLSRVVKFFLGKDVVAEVTLVGRDCPDLYKAGEHPQSHKYWAVRQIRYRRYWMPKGVTPDWFTGELDGTLTHHMDCVLPAAD